MNYIDAIVIIILILSFINGFSKGFVHQIASLGALILGIYLAIRFARMSGDFLSQHFILNQNLATILSFVFIIIIVMIGIHFLGKMIENILEEAEMGILNRMSGAVFAVIKSILILSVLFVLINMFEGNLKIISEKNKEESYFYKPIASIAPEIIPYFKTVPSSKTNSSESKK